MDTTTLRKAPIPISFFQAIGPEEIRLIRRAPGALSGGEWIDGGIYSYAEMKAMVQPAAGEELIFLEEGDRAKEAKRVWIPRPFVDAVFTGPEFEGILLAGETDGRLADVLLIGGKHYEIQKIEEFEETDIPHFDTIAIRFEAGATL